MSHSHRDTHSRIAVSQLEKKKKKKKNNNNPKNMRALTYDIDVHPFIPVIVDAVHWRISGRLQVGEHANLRLLPSLDVNLTRTRTRIVAPDT